MSTETGEYAVVIDHTIDAVWLRDVCYIQANKHRDRAAAATQRKASTINLEKAEMFQKYAERFEHIRAIEAARITRNMGLTPREET